MLRFGLVGGGGFVVDAGILSGLVALGLTPFLSRVFSIAGAILFTWLLNRSLTFRVKTAPTWAEFAHYVAISIVGALINYAVFSGAMLLHAPMLVALAIGTLCGTTFNFVRYRALLAAR